MRDEDIAAVVAIEQASFSAPKDELIFRNDQNKYLVAKEGGKIVGYMGVEKISEEVHIVNMAVHPDFRGEGVGKRLVEKILNHKEAFFLEVRVSNIAAQKLYGKYGFKVVGTRKKYYNDNNEDAFVMKRGGK